MKNYWHGHYKMEDNQGAWEKRVILCIDCTKDREGILILYVLEASVKLVKRWFDEGRGFKNDLKLPVH